MSSQKIQQGSVVSLSYTLTDPSGEEIDRAEGNEPFVYLHGYGQIVPGLEDALLGLEGGAKKQVVIEPKDGYGDLEPQLRTAVRRDQLPKDAEIEVGTRFMADQEDGESIVFTVVKLENDMVHLDGNHPLAGITLHFDVEVLEVRPATAEEISHGHAHGPGGHHHHDH